MPKPDQTAYDPFTPAPGSARILGTRDAFSLWFSLGVGLLVFFLSLIAIVGALLILPAIF